MNVLYSGDNLQVWSTLGSCHKYNLARVDPYGFERPEDFDYASYEAFFSRYLVVLTRRAIKWSKLLKGNNSIQKSLKVKRYIRKGIPNEHRALVWMIVSGAQTNMEQNPGYYHRLLEGEKNAKLLEAIKTDYYSPAMLGLKTDQEVLGELVKMKVPAVAELMERHGVMWTLVVSRWFICLFIDILPVETVLRIWDCLFYEGSKIIFRVALTLIKQNQAFILEATNFPDICDKFKQITKGTLVTECHSFMQKIFTDPGSLSMATINKLRETCREKLLSQG
ncbi:growth hormone-regulated TBC protein 1 isoform X3 [Vidua macroura]|uniref:growth hormone-regulated TBC protein 1 isoform X3 n=1 Tax=Vidua chalybeata TaxID=81927 RepID=UPI0023A7B03A|nr:growth hormone-regulated TBC protein 1 isoform X3 [Vidua chalybeata]XP_053827318.1 growth hormone-regulated TBC protein 1 isoform X3 [Vidua macroura]